MYINFLRMQTKCLWRKIEYERESIRQVCWVFLLLFMIRDYLKAEQRKLQHFRRLKCNKSMFGFYFVCWEFRWEIYLVDKNLQLPSTHLCHMTAARHLDDFSWFYGYDSKENCLMIIPKDIHLICYCSFHFMAHT